MFDRIEKVVRFYPMVLRVGLRSEDNETLRRIFDTFGAFRINYTTLKGSALEN